MKYLNMSKKKIVWVDRGKRNELDMSGIGVVFDCVTGILALVIHLVFLHVALIDVLGGHAESLGE